MALLGTASSNQTERAMAGQLLLAFGSLIVLVLFSSNWPVSGRVVGWTVMTICCASLVGALLGLLFGLPTQRVEVTRAVSRASPTEINQYGSQAARTSSNPMLAPEGHFAKDPSVDAERIERTETIGIPYAESTSLEQVADWLTKIIIGVTLTQYSSWEQRFFELSVDVTANLNGTQALLGRCVARFARASLSDDESRSLLSGCSRFSGGAIPGGLLMLTFAALGFLIAYLWMRRYFIIEMVVARNSAIEKMHLADVADREVQLTRALAAQVKSNAELDQVRQEAAKTKAQLAETRRVMEDQARIDLAKSTATLQLHDGYGDAAYAIAALTRAQQLVPKNEEAQAACRDMTEALSKEPPHYPDDPWRGLFGGAPQSLADNVQLTAAVTSLPTNANLFEVVLTVGPAKGAQASSLSGQKAVFFLHPTFGRDPRAVSFGPDGQAVLRLISYGAFTVGVLLESGRKLELNLAEVPEAPELFRVM